MSDDYTQRDFSSGFDFSRLLGIPLWVPQLTIDVISINDEERRTVLAVLQRATCKELQALVEINARSTGVLQPL